MTEYKMEAEHATISVAADLAELLKALVDQIEKNDFVDSLGHQAKMLKAFHDARNAVKP